LLCDPLSNYELKVAAQKAEMIYRNHNWISPVQSIVEVPVFSYNNNFMDLWLVGAPNLLHRALGITLNKGYSATVTGANLYIADSIYQQTIIKQDQSLVQPKRKLHQFLLVVVVQITTQPSISSLPRDCSYQVGSLEMRN
jgi:hypothetical protein